MPDLDNPTLSGRLFSRVSHWARSDATGGVLLILFTLMALVWANSPAGGSYSAFWHTEIGVTVAGESLTKTLSQWINDGLMFFFFLLVGLEIKRELLVGELKEGRAAALPVIAAAGGMIVPAAIYLSFNYGTEGAIGWGIPMATDIVFAVGILALFGKSVPAALKIFLIGLAIVDDIGAVLIIAVFYTEQLFIPAVGAAFVVFALLVAAARLGIRSPVAYGILGFFFWLSFLYSGIHPVIAAVLLALIIPARAVMNTQKFMIQSASILEAFKKSGQQGIRVLTNQERQRSLEALLSAISHVDTPLRRIEHAISPWVVLLILPVFALANGGIRLDSTVLENLTHPVSLGVILGLVLGKQAGVFLFSLAAIKSGLAIMPPRVRLADLYAVSWLTGIGFTVSLFISELAFGEGELARISQSSVLIASTLSIMGAVVLLKLRRGKRDMAEET